MYPQNCHESRSAPWIATFISPEGSRTSWMQHIIHINKARKHAVERINDVMTDPNTMYQEVSCRLCNDTQTHPEPTLFALACPESPSCHQTDLNVPHRLSGAEVRPRTFPPRPGSLACRVDGTASLYDSPALHLLRIEFVSLCRREGELPAVETFSSIFHT